jgi:hypothetical protein
LTEIKMPVLQFKKSNTAPGPWPGLSGDSLYVLFNLQRSLEDRLRRPGIVDTEYGSELEARLSAVKSEIFRISAPPANQRRKRLPAPPPGAAGWICQHHPQRPNPFNHRRLHRRVRRDGGDRHRRTGTDARTPDDRAQEMMRVFAVTVRSADDQCLSFFAIGKSSSAVHASALDLFGGLCSVVVIPH